jgi:CheY-like chemotaxis protein
MRAEALPTRRRDRGLAASSESRTPSEKAAVAGRQESARPAESTARVRLTGLKVVVVDDNEGNLDYFAVALRTYGAVVATASNAVDALRLVQEQQPDVVLSDIAMVGHDGYWLVREIRRLADASVQHVPVIATTAYGREHSRARTLAAGFSEHLSKPVDPELLCRTIAAAAGR